MPTLKQFHHPLQVFILIDYCNRIIVITQIFNLIFSQTEQEEIVIADLFANFDIRPIQRTNS